MGGFLLGKESGVDVFVFVFFVGTKEAAGRGEARMAGTADCRGRSVGEDGSF